MKIDTELVLELRKAQSWSQEELAIAAGLNLRTVQRIETGGPASLQSKKALASAFNIEVADLDHKEIPIMTKFEYKVLKFDAKGWMSRKVDPTEMEVQLNEHGAQGWDLMHISDILEAYGTTKMLVAILRRPLV